MDAAAVQATVRDVAAVIAREYMDAAVGERLADSLTRSISQGRYRPQTPEQLSERLTRDLFEQSKDRHLAVSVIRNRPPGDTAASSREDQVRRTNAGVQHIEILSGNIASYFFTKTPQWLFEILPRSGDRVSYETAPVPFADERRRPFVLTSQRTFSAGEGLAFLLQERRRAIVVGERTAGAANPGRGYQVNALFEVTVPNGRIRTAVRGTSWEGVGVRPDVDVKATDALRVAHRFALEAASVR